jgi:Mannosyltransferase (PIG-V)
VRVEEAAGAVPIWVRALDAIAIVTIALAACVVIVGGFAVYLGPLQLPVRSPVSLLFIGVASLSIRHIAHPSDPVHRRLTKRWTSIGMDSAESIVVGATASRIAVLLVGYFAVLTVGVSNPQTGLELSADPLFNLPARFDAGWYGGIAIDGYYYQGRFDRQQNVAFFPAVPYLMRVGGFVAGAFERGVPRTMRMARTLWAGVVISILAFAWAAHYLVRLARDTIGDERSADAVGLLAAYPFAVFFSAPYTESVFLLGVIAAFFHFRRQEWVVAAAWGALVGLTRPNGCFLSLALALMIVEEEWARRRSSRPDRASAGYALPALAAVAPVVGMLVYSAYVNELTGSWFGWARLHETWGRSFEGVTPIVQSVARIDLGGIGRNGLLRAIADMPFDALNGVALIFALVMVWPVIRRLGVAWGVFVLVNVAVPLLAGGVLSMGRITSTLFPVFLALATMVPRRFVTPVITGCALGQGLVAALFFTWRPLF